MELSVRAEAVGFFGASGNFLICADSNQPSEVAEWLSSFTKRKWAVLQVEELRRYRLRMEELQSKEFLLPLPLTSACYTAGLVFRIGEPEAITSIEATTHARFQKVDNRVVAAWKLDRSTDAGTKDAGNRGGGWGAVATEVKKQVGGIWTARTDRTVRGLLNLARHNGKTVSEYRPRRM